MDKLKPLNKWVELRCWEWVLVAPDGLVVARVSKNLGGLYVVGKRKYIDLKSAKQAAEKKTG